MGCVYLAKNKINGRCYIGKTINTLNYRKRKHIEAAKNNNGYYFHRAIRKYGENNFEWMILLFSEDNKILCEIEQGEIKKYNSKMPNGYNLTDGGEGTTGFKCSDETLAKLSLNSHNRGKKLSDEVKNKISQSKKGHPNIGHRKHFFHSEETKERISASLKGKSHPGNKGFHPTEETKRKISAALKGRKGNIGYRPTKETCQKISEALKGKTRTKEFCQKMSNARKGVPHPNKSHNHSIETRKKISLARTGKKYGPRGPYKRIAPYRRGYTLSPENRRKISLGMLGKKRGPYRKKENDNN